jgi:hypothetical protein
MCSSSNHYYDPINPRNLIIGCGKGYRGDLVFPHNHQNYITIDIDPIIRPDHIVNIETATPDQLQMLTRSGLFREIYFENVFLADLQTARNVSSLLVRGIGCVYYVGDLSRVALHTILNAYCQLNFNVTYADYETSRVVKEKLFPPQLIYLIGEDTKVIKVTPRPLPSFNEAFGHLFN